MTQPTLGRRERAQQQARELEQKIHTLVESQWGEPAVAVYLDYVAPKFHLPGRNKDGAVPLEKKRSVRRFFVKVLRALVVVPIAAVVMLFTNDLPVGGGRRRSGRVTGPENPRALELVGPAQSAGGPCWLVYTARPAEARRTTRRRTSPWSPPATSTNRGTSHRGSCGSRPDHTLR